MARQLKCLLCYNLQVAIKVNIDNHFLSKNSFPSISANGCVNYSEGMQQQNCWHKILILGLKIE